MSEQAPTSELAAPAIPLAGTRERVVAQFLFVGSLLAAVPAVLLTLYSLLLIYVVFPVVITGLLNWWGWWLVLNYRRRGWDQPMRAQPRTVWIMSLVFNAVPLVGALIGVANMAFQVGLRANEVSVFLGVVAYLLWLAAATAGSIVALLELKSAEPRPAEVPA